MSVSLLLSRLALPPESRVDQRVPKKLLLEQGLPTAADKRAVQEGVDELLWVAALKPETIGVPAYRDEAREYLEIAVLALSLRAQAKVSRLVELLHRAVPYPVLLVVEQTRGAGLACPTRGGQRGDMVSEANKRSPLSGDGTEVSLSLAHKRHSQGEGGKVVVEEIHHSETLRLEAPNPVQQSFLESLALSQFPSRDLFSLYQAWVDRLTALQAAQWRGTWKLPETPEQAAALRGSLEACTRIQRELASNRARAAKESQMNRRVALNLEIRRLETELKTLQLTL
jgi:hypothetical protein